MSCSNKVARFTALAIARAERVAPEIRLQSVSHEPGVVVPPMVLSGESCNSIPFAPLATAALPKASVPIRLPTMWLRGVPPAWSARHWTPKIFGCARR